MEYGGSYSGGGAGAAGVGWLGMGGGGVSLAIIKLQIGITLRRFNGVLWLTTSFAAASGPLASPRRDCHCVISLFQAGPDVCRQHEPILKEQMKCGPLNVAIHTVIGGY